MASAPAAGGQQQQPGQQQQQQQQTEQQEEGDDKRQAGQPAAGGTLPQGGPADAEPAMTREPSWPSPHFDASKEIVLRYESLSGREIKTVIVLVWFVVALCIALVVVMMYLQESEDPQFFLRKDVVPICNTVAGTLTTAALLAYWMIFFRRLRRSNASGKRWTHRRKRLAGMAAAELTLALINSVAFLTPNSWLLAHECGWFSNVVVGFACVRWTAWSTIYLVYWVEAHSGNPAKGRWAGWPTDERAPAVVDAPLWLHWPKLTLWLAVEGVIIAAAIITRDGVSHLSTSTADDCRNEQHSCKKTSSLVALASCFFAFMLLYFLLYAFAITRAFNSLLKLPYNLHRNANLVVRMQIRLRGLSILFFCVCSITYTFVGLQSCNGYILSWLGYLPVILVFTLTALANGYFMTPCRPKDAAILTVWLQEFAWTEADLPKMLAERSSNLTTSSDGAVGGANRAELESQMQREPMFCFETALKCLYWSFLAYDYEEVPDTPYTVEDALHLYALREWRMLWEKEFDTKCFVAWNDERIVISFRGTASLRNAATDSQVWRTRWPPGIGRPLLGTAPMVHWGFHKAWTANGFREQLLTAVRELVHPAGGGGAAAAQPRGPPKKILVTGHSLGGALATLCAFDLVSELAKDAATVACITFGAPRTGNHAWARMFNEAVPNCWHVINGDDVVTQGGKFLVLYKRGGHRALINQLGDLVVRPSYAETTVRKIPGDFSLSDHLLTSYKMSFAAVLGCQFSAKSFENGRTGVLRLARQKGAAAMLGTIGLAHDTLSLLEEKGWEAYLQLQAAGRRRALVQRLPWRKGSKQLELAEEGQAAEEESKQKEEAAGDACVRQEGGLAAAVASGPGDVPPVQRQAEAGRVEHTASRLNRILTSNRTLRALAGSFARADLDPGVSARGPIELDAQLLTEGLPPPPAAELEGA